MLTRDRPFDFTRIIMRVKSLSYYLRIIVADYKIHVKETAADNGGE